LKDSGDILNEDSLLKAVLEENDSLSTNLKQLAVIYPGTQRYELGDKVVAVPFEEVEKGMKGLFRIKN
jgi:hypothetical protein